jgi:hypothetical protein
VRRLKRVRSRADLAPKALDVLLKQRRAKLCDGSPGPIEQRLLATKKTRIEDYNLGGVVRTARFLSDGANVRQFVALLEDTRNCVDQYPDFGRQRDSDRASMPRSSEGEAAPGRRLWRRGVSLDNVLAIAAAAKGSRRLIVFGLVLSAPLVMFGARFLMSLVERYPILVWGGAAILGWAGGELISGDSFWTARGLGSGVFAEIIGAAGCAFVLAIGAMMSVYKSTQIRKQQNLN